MTVSMYNGLEQTSADMLSPRTFVTDASTAAAAAAATAAAPRYYCTSHEVSHDSLG